MGEIRHQQIQAPLAAGTYQSISDLTQYENESVK